MAQKRRNISSGQPQLPFLSPEPKSGRMNEKQVGTRTFVRTWPEELVTAAEALEADVLNANLALECADGPSLLAKVWLEAIAEFSRRHPEISARELRPGIHPETAPAPRKARSRKAKVSSESGELEASPVKTQGTRPRRGD
jgi:hypothetical protein